MALVAAVALEECAGRYVAPALLRLKWPNDLLLGGAKVAGILLERAEDAVVIGIGVNLAHHPALPDRATTSLADHGAAVTPIAFAERLAAMVAAWLSLWRRDGLAPVIARWSARAHAAGTPLTAHLPDGASVTGRFERLAEDGALVLGLADGSSRVIHAGDVFLV